MATRPRARSRTIRRRAPFPSSWSRRRARRRTRSGVCARARSTTWSNQSRPTNSWPRPRRHSRPDGTMNENASLKSLRDRPFELLAELERRGRAVTAAAASENPGAREWVGVAFRMAGELYLAAREETREVLAVPAGLTRVPGAKTWVKGIANVRGQLLPILDLRQYLGSGVTPNSRNVRVIVVNHREVPAGLLVDEVLGFRRFSESEFSGDAPPTVVRCERYLAGAFKRGPEQWPVLSLRQLVESPSFQEAAA